MIATETAGRTQMAGYSRYVVRGTSIVSLALFVTACVLPAFEKKRGHPIGAVMSFSDENDMVPFRGWEALALGWVAVLAQMVDSNGPFEAGGLGWLANPLGLASLLLLRCRRPTAAAVAGWLGVIFGAAFLVDPPSDAGRPLVPLVGSYLWVASLAAIAVGASAAGLLGWRFSATASAEGKAVRN